MFNPSSAFSGFSINDLATARTFYKEKLGCDVEDLKMGDDQTMGLTLHLPGNLNVFLYAKPNHEPATYTVLNFVVKDIDEAVAELSQRGIHFEQYEGMHQDEKGIARGLAANMGPDIAWFKDPAGNILAVLQEH